jgi:hypothetical protein
MKNLSFLCSIISFSLCQEIPIDFYTFDEYYIKLNSQKDIANSSIFGSAIYDNNMFSRNIDSIAIDTLNNRFNSISYYRVGLDKMDSGVSIYGYYNFIFNKSFYIYLYPRIVNDPNLFNRYSGLARDNKRGGFSSGEVDISGMGYKNKHGFIQIGRGRQGWGAGEDTQLILSNTSHSYDYFLMGFRFGKVQTRYMHGFLESLDNDINRYIVAKGFEYKTNNSFAFGISEIVIYSGQNRPIDFSYINPISNHLEIEMNNRQNLSGTGNGNAVWQLSLNKNINRKLLFSGNFIIDELVLDKIERDGGKSNGLGGSIRMLYRLSSKNKIMNVFGSIIFIGTHTYRHEHGGNNFVHRGSPLGIIHGSDFINYNIGLNVLGNKTFLKSIMGYIVKGSNSIENDPYLQYVDYNVLPFPSGVIKKELYIFNELKYKIKNKMIAKCEFLISQINSSNPSMDIKIGLNLYIDHLRNENY